MKDRAQSERLWSVKWRAQFQDFPNSLWILGETPEIATRKARRFLKKDGCKSVFIKSVESHGTIDVF
jgi:hypothetical protein